MSADESTPAEVDAYRLGYADGEAAMERRARERYWDGYTEGMADGSGTWRPRPRTRNLVRPGGRR